jgi:hypothetical protein
MLDPVTGDLDLSGGLLKLTSGADAVRQKLFIRLGLHLGEWFLDQRVGMPYHRDFLQKNPSMVTMESVLRKAITTCPGVASLDQFSLFLGSNRVLSVTFEAKTLDGTPIVVENFVPGGAA